MGSRARRMRDLARILRGETRVTAAARRALDVLLDQARRALEAAGYDTSVLDSRNPAWRAAVEAEVEPAVRDVFAAAFDAAARGVIDPNPYAVRHLATVHNRLVGVADEVYDQMRTALAHGRDAQESIPELAARVDALLADSQRWAGRARTIARTEVIGANNAGARASAAASAELLGVDPAYVVKEWLATTDSRTRRTHKDADGQQVLGIDTPFRVGGDRLDVPGDPHGPASEVVNCRCTPLFSYPGDPDYPTELSGGRATVTELTAPSAVSTDPGLVAVAAADSTVLPNAAGGVVARQDTSRDALRARGLTADAHLTAAPDPEDTVTTTPPEADQAPTDEVPPLEEPTHAGVAVQAADTGRVLLIQRSLSQDDAPDVAGTWEFPGGTIEDGETPEETAWREFGEETGLPAPPGETTGGWRGPDGVYQGFVHTTPVEADAFPAGINPAPADRVATDPDATDPRTPDVQAWFTLEQIDALGPALRPAVRDNTDWSQFMPTPTTAESQGDGDLEAALQAVRRAGYEVASLTAAEGDEPVPVDPEAPALTQDIATDGEPFYGVAVPEEVSSGDYRVFAADSLTWRDLPLPLMYQDATQPGHDGAVRVGRIDVIERDTSGPATMIRYAGVWDTSETAIEARRQVEARILRGVSIDYEQVEIVVDLLGSDGQPLDPEVDPFPEDGVVIERQTARAARIAGVTCCSIPAFHQAYIANGTLADRVDPEPGLAELTGDTTVPPAEEDPVDVVAASGSTATRAPAWSLAASAVGLVDPDAFTRPDVLDAHETGTPLTVTADGRVYGHLAVWGTCHIGIDGLCQEPPASASNYAYFATGALPASDGTTIPVGPLVMETGHAGLTLGHRAAASHYDNTGTVVADVTMGQDHVGIWFAGLLRPTATEAQVYALRAAGKVSGDWRGVGGDLELVAALVVNTPGFSIPRPALAASAAHGAEAMVAAGIVRTPTAAETPGETLDVVGAVLAALDRRDRARTAGARLSTRRASVRRDRVAAAAARLRKG